MKKFYILLLICLFISLIGRKNNKKITDEIALNSIKNYCYSVFPDLKSMIDLNEYGVNFEIVSSDDKEIVILFKSYTGAIVKYYIDVKTGDTYATETVLAISDKEMKTDEEFNIYDYIK